MMIRKAVFLLVCSAAVVACNKKPDKILSPKEMQAVLWDVLQADAFTSQYQGKDSSKNLPRENAMLQLKIFAMHKTDRKTFYKSYSYYKAHSDLLKNMLDSMVGKANKERGNLNRFNQPVVPSEK